MNLFFPKIELAKVKKDCLRDLKKNGSWRKKPYLTKIWNIIWYYINARLPPGSLPAAPSQGVLCFRQLQAVLLTPEPGTLTGTHSPNMCAPWTPLFWCLSILTFHLTIVQNLKKIQLLKTIYYCTHSANTLERYLPLPWLHMTMKCRHR